MTRQMITDVGVVDLFRWAGPGDRSRFVKVVGESVTGWYGPVADDVARYVAIRLRDLVTGIDVHDHVAVLAALIADPVLGPAEATVRSWAIGAVDCAVWDAHGTAADLPVAALLAATPRRDVALYSSWLTLDIDHPASASAAARVSAQGWRFTKWSARRALGESVDSVHERMARFTTAAGARCAFDALWTWDEPFLASVSEAVDGWSDLIWVEEPTPAGQVPATDGRIPLALGERLRIDQPPTDVLSAKGLEALVLDVVGCGGLTNAVRVAEAAKRAGVPVIPHGRSLMPALQLAAGFPSAVPVVEYQIQWEPRRQALYETPFVPTAGAASISSAAGIGTKPRSA
ncbi:hypothetical protein GCM10027063_36890 [Promicromonospora xylanilytica]